MALSDRERSQLRQIQAALSADSPRLARRLARHGGRAAIILRRLPHLPRNSGRALIAVLITMAAGLGMLVPGGLLRITPLVVIGLCTLIVVPLPVWLFVTRGSDQPRIPGPPARAI